MNDTETEDFEYVTRVDVNIAILREIAKIRCRERLRRVMPLVAQHLVAAGVDFSRVDFSKVSDASDSEIDAIYEDLF